MRRGSEFPPCYYDNGIVLETPADVPVVPMVIYVDGISFTRTDNVIGFYCYTPVSNKRTLMAVMRRSEFCDCGCAGWCGLYKVWDMIRWSLVALRAGQWPTVDQAGMPLRGDHATRAGTDLNFRAFLIFCKADWA